jgi:hypothetical protein
MDLEYLSLFALFFLLAMALLKGCELLEKKS